MEITEPTFQKGAGEAINFPTREAKANNMMYWLYKNKKIGVWVFGPSVADSSLMKMRNENSITIHEVNS